MASHDNPIGEAHVSGAVKHTNAAAAVRHIAEIYQASSARVTERFKRFAAGETTGDPASDACYPLLGLEVRPDDLVYDARPAWGTIAYSGAYATTLDTLLAGNAAKPARERLTFQRL